MDTRSIYTGTQSAARDTNKVLRNTYMLLSLTLGFSAVVAGVATVMNMPPLHWAIFLIGVYGLMFLTEKNRDNGMGLVFTFALTGLLGYSLGPIINMYMNNGGGETNYISATVTLYVSIYNIFLSLLSLLGGNRN